MLTGELKIIISEEAVHEDDELAQAGDHGDEGIVATSFAGCWFCFSCGRQIVMMCAPMTVRLPIYDIELPRKPGCKPGSLGRIARRMTATDT